MHVPGYFWGAACLAVDPPHPTPERQGGLEGRGRGTSDTGPWAQRAGCCARAGPCGLGSGREGKPLLRCAQPKPAQPLGIPSGVQQSKMLPLLVGGWEGGRGDCTIEFSAFGLCIGGGCIAENVVEDLRIQLRQNHC